jgi:hypothetical protein
MARRKELLQLLQLRLILKWRYIRVHHLAFAVDQKYDRPYDKKCDRPSIMLNLLSQTIDQRQAALDATHSIPVRDRKS